MRLDFHQVWVENKQKNIISVYLYSMCHLICDVIISCCVWSCDTSKVNTYDKIVIQNQKKRKSNKFYTDLHLKDALGMKLTAY